MTATRREMAAGAPIRALIVDDSVVIRRLVTHALAEDKDIEVVGSAANGLLALKLIPLHKPDLITLDIEMPEMNGLETLREIRKLYPRMIVIMFSTLSERGAAITLEALALGANDYVTKAANIGSLDVSMARLRQDLIPRIKQFFHWPNSGGGAAAVKAEAPALPKARAVWKPKGPPCTAVAIGTSTGGPTALAAVMAGFPPGFALPVFIVQHMPPVFTRLLADRLQTLTKLHVVEAVDGMKIEGGTVYIAPGDFHMRARKNGLLKTLSLDRSEPENFCRPAVDVMFRSVAEVYGGGNTVAVVMTGMGQDGKKGVEVLREQGAWIIIQDEPSSVVWGMPGAVARAGLADVIVDLNAIAPEILKEVEGRA